MEERIAQTIRSIDTLGDLVKLELDAQAKNILTNELKDAIRARTVDLGRILISERTGLDLTSLSPAEEDIVYAVGKYTGVLKLQRKDPTRTLNQLCNRGLIGAAEISVSKKKPTQGFTELAEAGLEELSYERIVLDHPEEFSPRAIWYSRRTLDKSNTYTKPPAAAGGKTEIQTERLLQWFRERSQSNNGTLGSFTNAEAAADALDIANMQKSGRAVGNIQSRIDFACYAAGLPPLGLTADQPFRNAWQQQDREWGWLTRCLKHYDSLRQSPSADALWRHRCENYRVGI